jgi:hypothetical protein
MNPNKNGTLLCIALCSATEDEDEEDVNKAIDELDDMPF